MKRYVKEFANSELRQCSKQRKECITKILQACEKGLITDLEAVYLICESYYGFKEV